MGPPGYIQNWRTTANGLEANAEAHNDLPLCLDELGQIRGEHAAQIAYLLSGERERPAPIEQAPGRSAKNGASF